ncbi:MAG: hypothetical protein LBV79_10980 [Candidatus Adiutrix sp.]|nr:hypothetical protein [Candidatus Adiutrix sp.]
MHAKEIYTQTMPFCLAKMALGLATVVISVVILAILLGLAWLFNAAGVTVVLILLWIPAMGFVRFLLMHYVGYLVKAGHVAVVAEIMATGRVPDDQVAYGKNMVAEKFLNANAYFAIDKLVTGAVKQLQGYLQSAGNALDFLPGMNVLVKLGQLFVDISLGYIDECCLGYTFQQRGQNSFKSAADAVAIYAQNWKPLLGNSAKTTALVIGLLAAITLVVFIFLGLLCKVFALPGYLGFLVACVVALAVKFAFIDSYIMVSMMVAFMETVPATTLKIDIYGKLSEISPSFRELYEKGKEEVFGEGGSLGDIGKKVKDFF